MSSAPTFASDFYKFGPVRRLDRWLHAMPHPPLVVEISPAHVAAARWAKVRGTLESHAVEPLAPGAIVASPVEANIVNPDAVRSALRRIFSRVPDRGAEVALLVPDPVVRVFILPFETLPRRAEDALPLLRWRLKKSVPFEADETLISYMRQAPKEDGVDIVSALARLRIMREYESLVESAGMSPGVVLSSTLAALPLLSDGRPALLARVAGSILTTAIVREGVLCGYRCITLPADAMHLTPQALLDEIYPLAAYYQDSWSEGIAHVRLAGLGDRTEDFREPLERELNCPVGSLLSAASAEGRIRADEQPLAERGLDALIGWTLNRGA